MAWIKDGEAFTREVEKAMSATSTSRLDLAHRIARKTDAQQNAVYQRIRRAQKTHAWELSFAAKVADALRIEVAIGAKRR